MAKEKTMATEPILIGYAEDGKPIYSAFGIAPDMPFGDYYIG